MKLTVARIVLRKIKSILLISSLSFIAEAGSTQNNNETVRQTISLSGQWGCQFDSSNAGIKNNWQDSSFSDFTKLPGSLEENKKGKFVSDTTTDHLNQTYKYIGAAWYQKQIEIPQQWKNKSLQLILERTKVTWIWIDHKFIGKSDLISAPQVYDLTGKLFPGKHAITICVNNSPELLQVGGSHAISEHTQTNWNGVIGKMYLEAVNDVNINSVKITPDVNRRSIAIQVSISNRLKTAKTLSLQVQASAWNTTISHVAKPLLVALNLQGDDTSFTFVYSLGKDAQLWSEYHPALYHLQLNLFDQKNKIDETITNFGLRKFEGKGTQFTINKEIIFLRGKHDGCVFPLTGYPPADVDAWRKLFRIAKSYGINHYRFHSYTPPDAAFEAADIEGIYIQAELPDWNSYSLKDSIHTKYQYREGLSILNAFGNHPSFVMFSLGNELGGGDSSITNEMVAGFKNYDNRRLYTQGTNAFFYDPRPGRSDDYWVTMWTRKETNGKYDVRGSFATTEDLGNGIINSQPPNSRRNYSTAIKNYHLPIVGHEVGQYEVYPDYSEIPKYTGVLRPLNFKVFQKRLQDADMADQAKDFLKASGKFAALLYREEIEMALRTPGFAGFQLLDLQDYPGQGTALVGILNAFMQNKGLISAEEFREFNNDVVLQLLMDKYTWTNDESFRSDVQLVNYSLQNIDNKKIYWTVVDKKSNQQICYGTLTISSAKKGKINPLGAISFPLNKIEAASNLIIYLSIPGTAYKTEYPVWVYPQKKWEVPSDIIVAMKLDNETIEQLNDGKKVLLFPDEQEIKNKSLAPQFISEFWNWRMFKGIAENNKRPVSAGTLGILTNPNHPLFNSFPTDFYTNWQWWTIAKNARPLILDATNKSFHPIVQVIDNIDRNHKLGMIFECKTAKGKLLVCTADLPALKDNAEAKQLYYSIVKYMMSDQFNPKDMISIEQLRQLL
jgi:hypothetical protein